MTSEFDPTSSDTILSQENAAIEYLADLPFDDRITQLLEVCETHKKVTADITTDIVIDPIIFPPTSLDDETSITTVAITADLTKNMGTAGTRVQLSSEASHIPDLQIESVDDAFFVTQLPDGEIRTIDIVSATALILRATGNNDSALHEMLKQKLINEKMCHTILKRALINAGDATGETEEVATVQHASSTVFPGTITELRFGHRNVETPRSSELSIIIEFARQFEELDAEEAYRLEIQYENNTEAKNLSGVKTTMNKEVRSDIHAIKSINLFQMNPEGKKTEIDISNTTILSQFIDTFEALLDWANKTAKPESP
jgi:hypothetical protein